MIGPPGISQSQQLRDFVERFAGGVVASVADILVGPASSPLLCQIKMRVSARDHQRQHRETQLAVPPLPFFQQHGVNVAFQMIHGDQRLVQRKGQRLGIADADQQRLQPVPGPAVTASASIE